MIQTKQVNKCVRKIQTKQGNKCIRVLQTERGNKCVRILETEQGNKFVRMLETERGNKCILLVWSNRRILLFGMCWAVFAMCSAWTIYSLIGHLFADSLDILQFSCNPLAMSNNRWIPNWQIVKYERIIKALAWFWYAIGIKYESSRLHKEEIK